MHATDTVSHATAAIHLDLDRLHDGHDDLAELLDALVAAVRTGGPEAIDRARSEIHLAEDRLYEGHDDLAELLDALVAAVRAEGAAPAT
ncbi:hypothetical protein [Streptomyces sp. AC1-42T]|uniref:hypothetical protein n=1 Tax=Streptomyces sp. AC1-42T TaxID=2218665 RepID=UPI000DAB6DED|nr:hypothetical protein [Streptomyces sp. AC1-42T]PZT71557.1 hypothetical protein DNK55_33165 [Streptomyces sp. AC1-42T]